MLLKPLTCLLAAVAARRASCAAYGFGNWEEGHWLAARGILQNLATELGAEVVQPAGDSKGLGEQLWSLLSQQSNHATQAAPSEGSSPAAQDAYWPCNIYRQASSGDSTEGGIAPRTEVWELASQLARCGMRGFEQRSFPRSNSEWVQLYAQVAASLQALSSARTDNASYTCPQASAGAKLSEPVHDDVHEVEQEVEAAGGVQGSLRCPWCARMVADSAVLQDKFASIARQLSLATDEEVEGALKKLPQVEAAKSQSCLDIRVSAAAGLQDALKQAQPLGPLLAAAMQFRCGACELDALADFLSNSSAQAQRPHVSLGEAAGTLVILKCAVEVPEEISTQQLQLALDTIEAALWQATGMPAFHQAAAQLMTALVQSGRYRLLLAGFGKRLCGRGEPIREALGGLYESATIAEEASSILSVRGFQTFAEASSRHIAAAYTAHAATSRSPEEASVALANAALWLQETSGSAEQVVSLVQASFNLTVQMLSPALQFVVLRACAQALGGLRAQAAGQKALAAVLQLRLSFLARQILFWSPPLPLVVRIQQIDSVARMLHQAFIARIRIADAFMLKDLPDAEGASLLGAFEAARSRNRTSSAADATRPGAVQAALKTFASLQKVAVFPADVAAGKASLGAVLPTSPQAQYHTIRGVRADEDTGRVELLFERPRFVASRVSSPALTSEAVAAALEAPHQLQLQISAPDFTAPRSREQDDTDAQALPPAQHPFWLVHPGYDPSAPLSGWMLESTWALQNMLGEISVSSTLAELASIRVGCAQVSYQRHKIGFGIVDYIFDTPELAVSASLQGDSDAAPIADALLTHLWMPRRNGSSTETYGTLHFLRRLCALRATAALLNGTVVVSEEHQGESSLNDEIHDATEAPTARMQIHQQELDPDRVAAWLEVLGELHAEVLRSFGFMNLDPGNCWDNAFSFAKCCSIGEHTDVCWQPGFSEERCCLGQALASTENALAEVAASQLFNLACGRPDGDGSKERSGLVEAVSTWLRHPTGSMTNAHRRLSNSRRVVEIIENMGNECHGLTARSTTATVKHTLDARQPYDANNAMQPAVVVRPRSLPAARRISVDMSPPVLQERASARATARWPPESLEAAGIAVSDLQRLRKDASDASQMRAALPLASAAPHVRTLSRLQSMLWRWFRSPGHGEPPQDGRVKNQHVGPRPRDFAGKTWREATGAASELPVGSVVRISVRDSVRPTELAEVLGVLIEPTAHGRPQRKVTRLRSSQGHILYYDLSLPEWKVEAPLPEPEHGKELRWPECLRKDESIRATDDAGLFVNLLVFGIRRGCFRDDCSHSDHFDTSNPAACARTCSSIRACRFWSFWPSRSGGTCWLRRHDRYRIGMHGSISGSVDCKPLAGAADKHSTKLSIAEPTLFALAKRLGSTLTHSHPAHQWDLLRIMQTFGSSTASQVQAAEASALQRSALRFAWRAEQYLQRN